MADELLNLFVDSHCDVPIRLLRGEDINKRGSEGHFDFVRMREGGVDCTFFALYTPNDLSPDVALRTVCEMLSLIEDSVDASDGSVRIAATVEEICENKRNGVLSVALGIENGAPLGMSMPLLRHFRRLGVRYMTLTHNGNNQICDAALSPEKLWGGLSPFGREVIKEMNRIGMMVDVSHVSDKTFYDVLECSSAPVIASHSCCRALSDHPRNMSDDMIAALASSGGVIQINFCPLFLDARCDESDPDSLPGYSKVVDHIEHVIELAGERHVGIGSDFDGIDYTPKGLEDVSRTGIIIDELIRRGYSKKVISMITGGNLLRVMRDAELHADK